ncbi:MAG: hypothetical protein AMXMBFR34_20690 [Myxococcaceae bacterium]
MALKMRLKPQLSHEDSMANSATQAMAARGDFGTWASATMRPEHRPGGGHHVAGDDDEGHLQGEGDELPEAAAPDGGHLHRRAGRPRLRQQGDVRGHHHEDGGHQREDEGVGNPALGPGGEARGEAGEEAGGLVRRGGGSARA